MKDFDELLRRLQEMGYEIKQGKYISFRAAGQERFTRAKTLGAAYTKEAIKERIKGVYIAKSKPLREDKKIRLVVDLENSIKAQQSAGYERRAKIHNLKQAAKSMNFLTENKIEYYSDLESKIADIMTSHDAAARAVKEVEQQGSGCGVMKQQLDMKRLILLNLPYVFAFYFVDKIAAVFRLAPGSAFVEKLTGGFANFGTAFANPLPSFHPMDLLVGVAAGLLLKLAVYIKGKNRKKFCQGEEYGSARWGRPEDIKTNVKAFISVVKKYTDMQELDASILREFIDRIEVSHTDKKSKTREITIVYNFIGAFDFERAKEKAQNTTQKQQRTA